MIMVLTQMPMFIENRTTIKAALAGESETTQ
jgi:hypothetical protein